MSQSERERILSELEAAKNEGKLRSSRVREIVQQAFLEAIAELKEGSVEIRDIVRRTLADVMNSVNESGTSDIEVETTSAIEPTSATSTQTTFVDLFETVRQRVLNYLQAQYGQLKSSTSEANSELKEQYGDRYSAAKQRMDEVSEWYRSIMARAESIEPDALQLRQMDFEEKVSQAGANFSVRERQLRQRLKELLQTAFNAVT